MPEDYFEIPEDIENVDAGEDERPQMPHPSHQQYPHGQYPHHGQYPQYHQYGYPPNPYGQYYFGQNAPNMRPPRYIPRRPRFHPGSIRTCIHRFTYVWLNDGRNFWAWIPSVSRWAIYGYRWTGNRWVYFEADVNDVDTFSCG